MSKKDGIIYCNRCGRPICTEEKQDVTSFLTIEKEWGYFSEHKDGIRHRLHICENCCDETVKTFAIPPERETVTELI